MFFFFFQEEDGIRVLVRSRGRGDVYKRQRYLLYTLNDEGTGEETFDNDLWVIATQWGAVGRALQIENVLWAGWDPSAVEPPRIAYTTARSVSLPPGWEALNDLWLLPLPAEGEQAAPIRIVESAPATFGWWGGNYAWAPGGDRIAYAFADEIGTLAIPPADPAGEGASSLPATRSSMPAHPPWRSPPPQTRAAPPGPAGVAGGGRFFESRPIVTTQVFTHSQDFQFFRRPPAETNVHREVRRDLRDGKPVDVAAPQVQFDVVRQRHQGPHRDLMGRILSLSLIHI